MYNILKRLIDIVVSSTLIICLSPLFLLIALMIKINNPGPVIFAQMRIGLEEKPFGLYKFRTMRIDYDALLHKAYIEKLIKGDLGPVKGAPIFKISNDPRVTSFGAFLRRYALDGLPQLFNVFFGHISLVGPRPMLRYEYEELIAEWQKERAKCKPGIFSLSQIEKGANLTFVEMMELDIKYVKNRSFKLDSIIFFKSMLRLFAYKGGY